MIGPHATSVAARVDDVRAIRDRVVRQLPGHTMGSQHPTVLAVLAVPPPVDITLPQPAADSALDMGPEPALPGNSQGPRGACPRGDHEVIGAHTAGIPATMTELTDGS
jgi:hypothetical protein